MSRLYHAGCEISAPASAIVTNGPPDGTPAGGAAPVRDTSIKRSGLAAYKCSSGAGNTNSYTQIPFSVGWAANTTFYYRCYAYFAQLPAAGSDYRVVLFGVFSARLDSAGKLKLYRDDNGTQQGSNSAATIVTGQWYRIEIKVIIGSSAGINTDGELRLDGVTVATVSGLSTNGQSCIWGMFDAGAGANKDWYFDDVAVNDSNGAVNNTWCGDGKVILMVPTSDNQVGVWTAGAGAVTSLFAAVDNTPPVGVVVGSATNTSQIKSSATGSQTTAQEYRGDCGSYTAAGIASGDTINALVLHVCHGEEVSTGTKTGSANGRSNPVFTGPSITYGNDAGAIATYPATWAWIAGSYVNGPSVTLGNPLILSVSRTDAGTRLGDVCFLGVLVEYTPGIPSIQKSGSPAAGALALGTKATTFSRGVLANAGSLLVGVIQKALGKIGAVTSRATVSGVRAVTYARAGAVTTGTAIGGSSAREKPRVGTLAAGTITGAVRAIDRPRSAVVTAGSRLAGVETKTLNRAGAMLAGSVALAARAIDRARAGAATSQALAATLRALERVRAGTVLADTTAAGDSQKTSGGVTYAKAGTITAASAVLSARSVERPRVGTATTGSLASGGDAATHARTSILAAGTVALGIRTLDRSRVGLVLAGSVAVAARAIDRARAGVVAAGATAVSPRAVDRIRTGVAAAASLVSGLRNLVLNRANAVTSKALADGSAIKGAGAFVYQKTGTATAGATAAGVRAAVWSRAGAVTSATSAAGARLREKPRGNSVTTGTLIVAAKQLTRARSSVTSATATSAGVDVHLAVRTGVVSARALAEGTWFVREPPEWLEGDASGGEFAGIGTGGEFAGGMSGREFAGIGSSGDFAGDMTGGGNE
jgi:hypothetical protein